MVIHRALVCSSCVVCSLLPLNVCFHCNILNFSLLVLRFPARESVPKKETEQFIERQTWNHFFISFRIYLLRVMSKQILTQRLVHFDISNFGRLNCIETDMVLSLFDQILRRKSDCFHKTFSTSPLKIDCQHYLHGLQSQKWEISCRVPSRQVSNGDACVLYVKMVSVLSFFLRICSPYEVFVQFSPLKTC